MNFLDKDSLIFLRHYFTKKILYTYPLLVTKYKLEEKTGNEILQSEITIENVLEQIQSPGGWKVEYYNVKEDLVTLYVSTLQQRLFGPNS